MGLSPIVHNIQKAPTATSTSPRLKATWYGDQDGNKKRSDSHHSRVAAMGKITSLLVPRRPPICQAVDGTSGASRATVSGLMGINPSLRVMTVRLRIRPRPSAQKPG